MMEYGTRGNVSVDTSTNKVRVFYRFFACFRLILTKKNLKNWLKIQSNDGDDDGNEEAAAYAARMARLATLGGGKKNCFNVDLF